MPKIYPPASAWHTLPPVALPAPVLALAPGADGPRVAGMGGLARLREDGTWKLESATLPLLSLTALTWADDLLLAGGVGGLARSTDRGQTWQLAALAENFATVTAFAVSPQFARDQTILAATVEHGILRSEDGGQKWLAAGFGLPTFEVNALLWLTDEVVLAGTAEGLARSINGGRAWRPMRETEDLVVVALAALPDGTLLAALEEGSLLGSSRDGTRWEPFGDLPAGVSCSSLWTTPRGALLLSSPEQGLLRSDDRGERWERVLDELVLACAMDEETVYAGTATGVSRSSDAGRTWQTLPTPPLYDLHRLHLLHGRLLLSGAQTGLLRETRDGWQPIESFPSPLTGVFVHDRDLFVASAQGLRRSRDGGQSWQTVIAEEEGNLSYATFRPDGSGWAGSGDGTRLLRTRDGGVSWERLPAPFGVLALVALLATPDLVVAATYDARLLSGQIWLSRDEGESWQRAIEAQPLLSPIVSHDDPPLIALGNRILFPSPAHPTHWRSVSLDQQRYGQIRRVTGHRQLLLVLTTTGLYRSDDGGTGWRRCIEQDVPVGEIRDIMLTGETLFVLLAGGRVWSC